MKRIISALIAAVMIICIIPLSVSALSGDCSADVHWSYGTDFRLDITGTGAIPDYTGDVQAPWSAFADEIKSITIAAGITEIPIGTFTDFPLLEQISVDENNVKFSSDSAGILYDKNKLVLYRCPTVYAGDYTAPDSLMIVNIRSFYGCDQLTRVTLSANTNYIGRYAFYGCSKLVDVNMFSAINRIYEYTFFGCTSMTNISLIQTTEIRESAFENCTGIRYLQSLPNTLLSIGNGAFRGCTKLELAELPESVQSVGENAFSGCTSLDLLVVKNPDCVLEYTFEENTVLCSDGDSLIHTQADLHGVKFRDIRCRISHSWGEQYDVTESTCTSEGKYTHTCSRCGVTETLVMAKKSHSYGTFYVVTEATCLQAGLECRECSVCHNKNYFQGSYGHHSYITAEVPASCTLRAYTNYECSLCGFQYRDYNHQTRPRGHDCDKYIYNNDATTDHNGTSTGICLRCKENVTVEAPLTQLTPVDSSVRFVDIPQSKWYKEYVDYAATYKLFSGVTDTTFEPDTPMNRAMFVKVLVNLDGVVTDNGSVTRFSDVPSGKWYTGAVKWASDNGIVNGVSDNEYMPMKNINRQEMCTMLTRYASFKVISFREPVAKVQFSDDADISKFAKDSVYICQMAGIINGITTTEFSPKGTATRAQVSKILSVFHEEYIKK